MVRVLKITEADAVRTADGKWLIIYDNGESETIEHKEFLIEFKSKEALLCEQCGSIIDSYMDDYYCWQEGLVTCTGCGGPKELLIRGDYVNEC